MSEAVNVGRADVAPEPVVQLIARHTPPVEFPEIQPHSFTNPADELLLFKVSPFDIYQLLVTP